MDNFHVILSSNSNLDIFPENKSNEFRVVLPKEINLSSKHVVALTDLLLPPNADQNSSHVVYIYSDIVSRSIVSNSFSNVLRVTAANKTKKLTAESYINPIYIPLCLTNFRSILISFRDHKGKPFNFQPSNSIVTLHFKQEQWSK